MSTDEETRRAEMRSHAKRTGNWFGDCVELFGVRSVRMFGALSEYFANVVKAMADRHNGYADEELLRLRRSVIERTDGELEDEGREVIAATENTKT